MTTTSEKENLKQEIGVRSLTLAILNMTVGTGIFILPAIVAENLGAAAIIAYLVCGLIIFLIALCFAEVGSKITASGGTYTYIESAFGPFAGFIANNLFWIGSCVVSDAAIANALADTLKYFFPLLSHEIYRIVFFLLIFGGLALLNIRSVKNGVRFIEIAAFGKLVPLVILVIAGAGFVNVQNLQWTSVPSIGNIGTTSLLLIYAFLGIENPVSNGGEMKNAKRTLPLAIFLGISIVLILYISIQLVTQGILGNTLSSNDAPIAAVAGIIFGGAAITMMILVTSISMLGGLAGGILSIPRILYAGGRNGVMPKVFATVHPRYFTPHVAIGFYALLGFLFSLSSGFRQLAIISSAATLLIYLGVVLATIKLRKKTTATTVKTFRIPGGLTVPLLAIVAILWLLSNLTIKEFTGIVIFIMIFTLIFFAIKFFKRKT